MVAHTWSHLVQWMAGKMMYCPKCKKDMPFEKSVWDGAWVCQKCGYRMK
jgi:C4-type Zn-finger protein